MLLSIIGLTVVGALIVAGAWWLGQNVRFGKDKSESVDKKEMK